MYRGGPRRGAGQELTKAAIEEVGSVPSPGGQQILQPHPRPDPKAEAIAPAPEGRRQA